MEKYKSQYPTLSQAKVKWSKKVDPYAAPHLAWTRKASDFQHSNSREKLTASSVLARMIAAAQQRQSKIVREEAESEEHLYHVTHTKHVGKIQKHGLKPMQTSNWVKAGDKERYGSGEVYTFTHKDDAHQWAGRMDWAHHQKLGSGNISIITMKKPKEHQFDVDDNDPLSQAGQKGKWLKTNSPIAPHHIVSVEKYAPKKLGEAKDRIGKRTPSAEEIAKKHNKEVAEIQSQIDKGIKVEREHTKSDEEAHEIARDHLDEFPDYYDRLEKMEKKAKKDMKEGWDPEVEQIRNTIDAHKKVAEKMAQHHGEQSQEAAFHRAYVKHLTKQLKDVHGLDESKKVKRDMLGFKMMKNDPPVPAPKTPHPVPAGYERVKDNMGFNVLRKKKVQEDVANAVGGGMSPVIGGEGNIHGFDPIMGKPIRRRKFAGKQVFVVDPTTYHKAYLGKRKYEHYEKYLEGCDIADEIRAYGRKYWDEPIIIENEQTGAMVYLKYGRK